MCVQMLRCEEGDLLHHFDVVTMSILQIRGRFRFAGCMLR